MPSPKDKFAAEFYDFDFFQAVRLLEKLNPGRAPLGRDANPADEVARFRGHVSMAFPPAQIIAVDPPDDDRPNPLLTVTFFGLYGPSGVLPTHYTQQLMDIYRDVRGPERRSLRDWFDLFNHRMVSLFYRAWEKYRFHIPYERGEPFAKEPDAFTLAIRSFMGLGTPGLVKRLEVRSEAESRREVSWDGAAETPPLARIDDLALLYYAGFFAQRPRNPTNLRMLIADYFALPAEVRQFQGQWLAIPEDGQTQLGAFGVLGVNAVAGERVWDVQSKFRVRLGPLTFAQFEELLPDTEPAPRRKTFFLVAQLARLFAGSEYDFDVQLVLAAPEVPEAVLSDGGDGPGPRLGWTVWLISEPPAEPVDDAVFDGGWVTVL